MDLIDRAIINRLQDGFPICERPYAEVATELGLDEQTLIDRLGQLLDQKILSRFGPMYHAERLGGGLTLAAMAVTGQDFERVAEQVNACPEVAHNYARDHRLNMWFVVATETPEAVTEILARIEHDTGYRVYNLPKIEEFHVGLRFDI